MRDSVPGSDPASTEPNTRLLKQGTPAPRANHAKLYHPQGNSTEKRQDYRGGIKSEEQWYAEHQWTDCVMGGEGRADVPK